MSSPVCIAPTTADISGYFDKESRGNVCDWMYRIVEHFSLERESIFIGMSYYDRYIAKFPCNDKAQERQLVAATSLYMAVKINETRRKEDTIQCFFKLSDGRLSVQDITNMESQMLFGLNWLVNPPSPQTFVHQVTSLLCCTHLRRGSSSGPTIIYEVAIYITELSLLNDELTSEKASTLGLASMLIVLRGVKSTVLSSDQIAEFFNFLSSLGFDNSENINSVAYQIVETLHSNEWRLTLVQIYEKLDPSRIVFKVNEDE